MRCALRTGPALGINLAVGLLQSGDGQKHIYAVISLRPPLLQVMTRSDRVRMGWCENSERASTEGNRVLLAPRFPSWLAIARAGIGLERKVVLRVPRAQAFCTAKILS